MGTFDTNEVSTQSRKGGNLVPSIQGPKEKWFIPFRDPKHDVEFILTAADAGLVNQYCLDVRLTLLHVF